MQTECGVLGRGDQGGGPGSRLMGPMCVDMCGHVCAMPSELDSP